MKNMPDAAQTIHSLQASAEAKQILNNILERKQELEDIYNIIQPLLYTISVALYGENDETIQLQKLVTDAINHINGRKEENTLQ
jgi:hypothetical protein